MSLEVFSQGTPVLETKILNSAPKIEFSIFF